MIPSLSKTSAATGWRIGVREGNTKKNHRGDSPLILIILTACILWNGFLVYSAREAIRQGNIDFTNFYTAAQMVATGKGPALYDIEQQKIVQQGILEKIKSNVQFPGGVFLYSHPPFMALAYSMVAPYQYHKAYFLWAFINGLLYLFFLWWLVREGIIKGAWRIAAWSLAFLPLVTVFVQGQDTLFALAGLVLMYRAFKHQREFSAGLWSSLLLAKFQLIPIFLGVMLFKKRWTALCGFLAGAIGLAGISWAVVGTVGIIHYVRFVLQLPRYVNLYGFYPAKGQCVRGQFLALLGPDHVGLANALTMGVCLCLVGVLAYAWKQKWNVQGKVFDLQFSMTVLTSLLIAPHLNFHDLTLFLLPLFLILQGRGETAGGQTFPRKLQAAFVIVGFPVFLAGMLVSMLYPLHLAVFGLIALQGLLFNQLHAMEKY